MQFTTDHIYHIYNRGNNSQPIFFSTENYLFFLKKIRKHILPHADILAWCLMPNHFHLMVYVNSVEVFHEKEYPQVCFNYIHQNPVKSGLVKTPAEWEFSSYRDYVGLRDGKMINREKAAELGLKIS